MRSNVFEVVGSAVFLGQERFTVVELAGSAAGALGGVGAVEVRGVAVSNIAEPKRTQVSTMDRMVHMRESVNIPVNLGCIFK